MDWNRYENEARNEGFCVICGVDEAGRGPLAGPVFAAAVVLPRDAEIPGLNDSKKLTAAKRDALFDVVCRTAIDYAVASASEREIDEINILNATFLSMRRAVESLATRRTSCLWTATRAGINGPRATIIKATRSARASRRHPYSPK
jgi:ribonuclease HII